MLNFMYIMLLFNVYCVQKEKATTLTHLVLNYEPKDALVLCCVLRCMGSGLVWVIELDPNTLLQPYLQKVRISTVCIPT